MSIKPVTGKTGRYYPVDNQKMPSVTTVLNIVGGKNLITWAVNEACDYMEMELNKCKPHEVHLVLPDILIMARKRHRIIRDSAGRRGSDVHRIAETLFKGRKVPEDRLSDPFVAKVVNNLENWIDENGFEPLTFTNEIGAEEPSVEMTVYSKEHGFAGTADLIGKNKAGKLMLVDLKTGKSVHKTMEVQCAAYSKAYEEMFGAPLNKCVVLHVLPSGNVKEKLPLSKKQIEHRYSKFLSLLDFYKWYGDE